jgi:hypothetical protein
MNMQESKLAEEQGCSLHSIVGRDLLVELKELHICVARVEVEYAAVSCFMASIESRGAHGCGEQ